jgi:hypothetical protein
MEKVFATFITIMVVIIAISLGIGIVAGVRNLFTDSRTKMVSHEVKDDKKRFGKSYL